MNNLKIIFCFLFFSFSFSHETFELPSEVRMTLIDHEKGQINVYTYDQVYTLSYSLELLDSKKIVADDKFFQTPFFIMFPFEIDGVNYAALNGRSDVFMIDDNIISRLPSNFDFINHFTGASIFKYDNKIVKYGGYAFWNYFDQFIYYDIGLYSWELLGGRPLEDQIQGSESQVLIPINDHEVLIFSGYTDSSLTQFSNVYKFNFAENQFTLLGETNFDKFNRYANKINDNNYLIFENLSEDMGVVGSNTYTELAILNTESFRVYKVDEYPIHQYITPQNGVFFYDTDFHTNYPEGEIFLNGSKSVFANTILFYTKRDGRITLHSYPTVEILRNSRFDDVLFTKEYPSGSLRYIIIEWPVLSSLVFIFILFELIRFFFFRQFKYKLTFFKQSAIIPAVKYELLLVASNGKTFGFQHQGKFYSLSQKCYNILSELRKNNHITNQRLEEIVFEDELSRSTNFRNKSKKLEQLELKIQSATNIDDKILIQVKSEFDSRFIDYKIIDSINIL